MMTTQMMSDHPYFDMYNQYMEFLVPDVTSRVLGQQDIQANVYDIYNYWQEAIQLGAWGKPSITDVYKTNRVLIFRVDNIKIGGITVSLWVWGLAHGVNTVVTKVGFWKLDIIGARGILNTIFNVPPMQKSPIGLSKPPLIFR